ncbi:MAG: hypothetical protein ABSC38_07150 [Verrucomicrobiia bacterium]
MRKHIVRMIVALSVVAVALTFAGVVRAQQEGAAAPKVVKAKLLSATGEIAAVDATAGTLSIKKGEATLSFTIAKDCKVSTADKKDATVTDLKVGDKVAVGYSEEAGAKVAHKISPPKPKAPKKDAAPKKDVAQ